MTGSDNTKLLSTDHIAIEVARLRAENNRLRQALRQNSRYARRIQRSQDAALQLALWHVGYLATTRAECMSRGLGQRQWENGITLLRLARVVDQAGRWRVHDLATIQAAIDKAADRAAAVPEAYFARGPRHMRASGNQAQR